MFHNFSRVFISGLLFQDVLDTLFVDVVHLVGERNFTFDTKLNHVTYTGQKGDYIREWLDYVMFR